MANELIDKWGTTKNLVTTGAAINAAAFSAASVVYTKSTDGSNYPHAKLIITGLVFAVAPANNKTIVIYARPLDLLGNAAYDSPVPTANYKNRIIAKFNVEPGTGNQYLEAMAYDLPEKCEFYIENAAGQNINANWNLDLIPFTYGPA